MSLRRRNPHSSCLELTYNLPLKLHSSHLSLLLLKNIKKGHLTSARTLPAENICVAQMKYYDKHARPISYSIGEGILIRFRHGPYHITALTPTDVKVYYPKESTIQVHMSSAPQGFHLATFVRDMVLPNGLIYYSRRSQE